MLDVQTSPDGNIRRIRRFLRQVLKVMRLRKAENGGVEKLGCYFGL